LVTGISLVLAVLGVVLSCLSNTGLLGVSYLLDDRGITGWTLGRATTILWFDVDRFEEVLSIESGTRIRYNLYTADGRWIFIHVSSLVDGDRFCARLEEYLAPLRKRASRESPNPVEAGDPIAPPDSSHSALWVHCSSLAACCRMNWAGQAALRTRRLTRRSSERSVRRRVRFSPRSGPS
jgi:hypothetical protein